MHISSVPNHGHAVTTDLSQQLIDFYTDAGDSAVRTIKWRPNHGVDFLALFHHHDAQVYKSTGARQNIHGSGAISIDVIGTGDGAPVAYRAAIDNEGVHLGQITFAIKVGHGQAPAWESDSGCGEEQAFYDESVIT
ncbi:MAG: hypothetical protein DMG82_19765 [Acidobacteria bacterium]|nr:MAG: hypothetical protein DMG82_19765 [Acidobacteriota bacterium]PYX47422.1 MAG: hypothetical protein DMG83_04650 [Acidobacteriota bacterium]